MEQTHCLEFLYRKLFKADILTSCFHLQELAISLRMYLENFPKKKYLHPYERSLIELTLGDGNYEEVNSYQLIVNVLYINLLDPCSGLYLRYKHLWFFCNF